MWMGEGPGEGDFALRTRHSALGTFRTPKSAIRNWKTPHLVHSAIRNPQSAIEPSFRNSEVKLRESLMPDLRPVFPVLAHELLAISSRLYYSHDINHTSVPKRSL